MESNRSGNNSHDELSKVSVTDTVQHLLSGRNNSMSGMAIKGHVTVQVEDKQGNVKQRVEADNALAPAALNALLYNGLTKFSTTAQTLLGFGGAINVSQVVVSLILMKRTQLAVYVCWTVTDYRPARFMQT